MCSVFINPTLKMTCKFWGSCPCWRNKSICWRKYALYPRHVPGRKFKSIQILMLFFVHACFSRSTASLLIASSVQGRCSFLSIGNWQASRTKENTKCFNEATFFSPGKWLMRIQGSTFQDSPGFTNEGACKCWGLHFQKGRLNPKHRKHRAFLIQSPMLASSIQCTLHLVELARNHFENATLPSASCQREQDPGQASKLQTLLPQAK